MLLFTNPINSCYPQWKMINEQVWLCSGRKLRNTFSSLCHLQTASRNGAVSSQPNSIQNGLKRSEQLFCVQTNPNSCYYVLETIDMKSFILKRRTQSGNRAWFQSQNHVGVLVFIRDGWYKWASRVKPSLMFTIKMLEYLNKDKLKISYHIL